MSSQPSVGKWELEANPLLEAAEVVFSELSASQASEEGFYLTGGLYFNEGSLQFENGRCSFYVKDVTLSAKCISSQFEPQTIAFRQTQRDSRSVEVSTTTDLQKKKETAANANASLAFQLPTGLAAGLGGGARADIQMTESSAQTGLEKQTIRQPLVWAIIRNRGDISWRIQADPSNVVFGGSLSTPVLSGARLMDSGEGVMGYIKLNSAGGGCDISLGVKHVNIVFTELEIDNFKPLKDLGGEILRGRDKRAIVGRLCLQKALEGSIRLGRLP